MYSSDFYHLAILHCSKAPARKIENMALLYHSRTTRITHVKYMRFDITFQRSITMEIIVITKIPSRYRRKNENWFRVDATKKKHVQGLIFRSTDKRCKRLRYCLHRRISGVSATCCEKRIRRRELVSSLKLARKYSLMLLVAMIEWQSATVVEFRSFLSQFLCMSIEMWILFIKMLMKNLTFDCVRWLVDFFFVQLRFLSYTLLCNFNSIWSLNSDCPISLTYTFLV